MKQSNIHLRPTSDKERFLAYIKESLELMQQEDFNEKKIIAVLDIVKEFLKKNKKYKELIAAKLRQVYE